MYIQFKCVINNNKIFISHRSLTLYFYIFFSKVIIFHLVMKTEFMANVRKYVLKHHVTEPHRPNHNFAEGVIREIRKKWFRVMIRKMSRVGYGITDSNGYATSKSERQTLRGDWKADARWNILQVKQ